MNQPQFATGFRGLIQRGGVFLAKLAGYNAAYSTPTTQVGTRLGTNSNSSFASIQRVGMNFTAEMVAKNSAIGAAYLATRQNYCSSQITYIPATGNAALDDDIKEYLHGNDGISGVFSTMGVDCSMQDAFMRTADIELPVRGDSGLIFWRDELGDLRLIEFSADQLGEIYNFTPPRKTSLAYNAKGELVEVAGNDCFYYAGRYMRGADPVAYKIYERTDSFYGNPRIYPASDVIYFRDPASFRGIRGVTLFANALEHMQKGEDLLSAALASAQRQARTTMAVYNNTGAPNEYVYDSETLSDGQVKFYEKQQGGPNVEYFYSGDKAEFLNPTAPGEEVVRAVETADERVAIALRLNYAFLISATKVGGAPSRLEVEKANKEFMRIKNTIHKPRLNRIKNVVLLDAVDRGILKVPYRMTRNQFLRGSWQLPISPSVDAYYSAKENIQMIRAGLESPQDIIGETNRNASIVLESKTRWAIEVSRKVQDANRELEAEGYEGNISAADIAQVTDNPQQVAQAEEIEKSGSTE